MFHLDVMIRSSNIAAKSDELVHGCHLHGPSRYQGNSPGQTSAPNKIPPCAPCGLSCIGPNRSSASPGLLLSMPAWTA